MLAVLRIQLLGDFEVSHNRQPVLATHAPRLQSLLAYLVVHRHAPQPRRHLAFLLWPDSSEAQARANLRYQLYKLRKALPDADRFFRTDTHTVQWLPLAACAIDVAEFESAIELAGREQDSEAQCAALERAVELYRGDLLPGCYDDWILPERERLRQAFSVALDRLVRLLESAGDLRAAISYAERQLRHDPLHEASYRRLMRLHAVIGDRASAVRAFHTCATVLQRELGVKPSVATRQAYERVLLGAEGKRPQGVEEVAPRRRRAPAPQHNLPSHLTSFIGREGAIVEVQRLLERARLVTLTGSGGCGKTRLALHVAVRLLPGTFEDANTNGRAPLALLDGVWWADLAALTDPAMVPQTVATALSVREQPGRTAVQMLSNYIRSRRLLLVLDNCEHLVEACAHLTQTLLHTCPNLRIMVTSREMLGVAGEVAWPVPPLSFPPLAGRPAEHHDWRAHEAIRLFVERAQDVLPTFALTAGNAPAVAQICRRLDGMPLAIELAAARVKVLSVEQIADRLDDRFRLLTAGSRAELPRHRTLRAAIDWSYDLLSEQERALFRRLSVFAGGFTLDAAEAVCTSQVGRDDISSYEVLELLSHLVDKSLVAVEAKSDEARYRMLETVRQYGRDRLREFGEEEATQQRHASYFSQLAEEAEPHLRGLEQVAWLNRLEREHDNLRAALTWSQKGHGGYTVGLRLAAALWWFWGMRGYLVEGRGWLESLLGSGAEGIDTSTAAKARFAAGALAWNQDDYVTARSWLQESEVMWQELGDKSGLGYSLTYLGLVALRRGDYAYAHSLFEKSRSLFEEAGDKWGLALSLNHLGNLASREDDHVSARAHFERALAMRAAIGDRKLISSLLNNYGEVARCQGDYSQAAALYQESLSLLQELDDLRGTAITLHNLAYVAWHEADHRRAARLFQKSLAMYREMDNRRGQALCLAGLAGMAEAEGRPQRAVRLFGAATSLLDAIGSVIAPADRSEVARSVAAVRAQLDEATFAAAWAEGQAMTLEQAIEDALSG